MEPELERLKDAFSRFVGQTIKANTMELGSGDKKMSYLTIDYSNVVVGEMIELADQLDTQVHFDGVIYAGHGGTEVQVGLKEQGDGQYDISSITPSYC